MEKNVAYHRPNFINDLRTNEKGNIYLENTQIDENFTSFDNLFRFFML